MKIGIIAAVRDEAEPLAEALGLTPQTVESGTYHLYANDDNSCLLITPGEDDTFKSASGNAVGRPGKVSAGVITSIFIERYKPDVIINAGTAAGVAAKSIIVGDIVVAEYVANHDIHIPLPGYGEYGTRKIAIHKLEIFKTMGLPYKLGTVSSAESFTSTHEEWQTMTANDVMAKEMEAAGVMQAVQIFAYQKPVYIIKALTNQESEASSDDEQASDYSHNFKVAMSTLTVFIQRLVATLESESRSKT